MPIQRFSSQTLEEIEERRSRVSAKPSAKHLSKSPDRTGRRAALTSSEESHITHNTGMRTDTTSEAAHLNAVLPPRKNPE